MVDYGNLDGHLNNLIQKLEEGQNLGGEIESEDDGRADFHMETSGQCDWVADSDEEARGLLRHIGKITDVYATTTVPKISVVLRDQRHSQLGWEVL